METNLSTYSSAGMWDGSLATGGFQPVAVQQQKRALHEARVADAMKLWQDVILGGEDPFLLRQAFQPSSPIAAEILCRRYPAAFRETMTTSDFTALTADVLDRVLLGNYMATPQSWRSICKVATLRDFRDVKRFVVNGAEQPWSTVPEKAPHTMQAISQPAPYTYAPSKYESGTEPLSWEAMINDDLGIFTDLPARLTKGAIRTIQKFVTQLHIDASGPHASLYTSGNVNIITSNPVLSVAALGTGLKMLRKMLDSGGDPILIDGKIILEVTPDLEVTAKNIMNQILVDTTEAGGTSNQRVRVNNWIVSNFNVVVNEYIPIVASSANGTTTWCLFADPAAQNRSALEVGFLRGYDNPVLLQKLSNTMRMGGGIAQEFGDWSTMSTEMKGLIVFGGSRIDPKSTVASNGSGS